MEFVSLFSGSSGNCYYLRSGHTRLLIDAGVSAKRIREALKLFDVELEEIDGILITHEHSDHIRGIDVLGRRCGIPVYMNAPTACYVTQNACVANADTLCVAEEEFVIKDVHIRSFPVWHDAVSPVGYTIQDGCAKMSLVTDTGCFTREIYDNIKGSDLVVLESNHDVKMLREGPYPHFLKQRILSSNGHLSNDDASKIGINLLKEGTKALVLGHISTTNNEYQLAKQHLQARIDRNGIEEDAVSIDVAEKYRPSRLHKF
jgi:phosphoribosyl 1,2-cyclic phosphodiesterase